MSPTQRTFGFLFATVVGGAALWAVARRTADVAAEGRSSEPERRPAAAAAAGPGVRTSSASRSSASVAAAPFVDADAAAPTEPRTSLRGAVVDARDRSPLADYALRVSSGAGLEDVRTGPDGRFATRTTFPAGPVRVELVELKRPGDLLQTRRQEAAAAVSEVDVAQRILADGTAAEVEIAAEAGPRFVFEAAWPAAAPPEDFSATLSCADPRRAFDRVNARVRAGNPLPWTRFSALAAFVGGGPPFRIALRSDDGLWFASVDVATTDGSTEPLRPVFERRARLRGRLTDEAGAPVAKEYLLATRDGASFASADNRPTPLLSDAGGGFDGPAMLPGDYDLRADLDGFEPASRRVRLVAGESTEVDVKLRRLPPPTGRASVRVVSRTGAFRGPAKASLVRIDGGAKRSSATADVRFADEGGAQVGRCTLEGLAAGTYRVSLLLGARLEAVEPAAAEVLADGPEALLTVLDEARARTLRFRVVAAEDGAPLAAFSAEVRPVGVPDARPRRATGAAGTAEFAGGAEGAAFAYAVRAEGRAPSFGAVALDADVVEVPVRAAAGYGVDVRVRDEKGEPLAGAVVRFDGVEHGVSDADGLVRAALPRKPARLSVEAAGRRRVPDSVVPEDGSFRDWMEELVVVMRPVR